MNLLKQTKGKDPEGTVLLSGLVRGAAEERSRGWAEKRPFEAEGTATSEEGNRTSQGLMEAPEGRQVTETVA